MSQVFSVLAGAIGAAAVTDGTGSSARFRSIGVGLGLDGSGNYYRPDKPSVGVHCVRKITPAGVVTTIATDAGGLVATSLASGFCSAPDGTCYYMSSNALNAMYVISGGAYAFLAGSTTGCVDGTGAAAKLHGSAGSIAMGSDGNVYLVDSTSFVVRQVTPAGVVTTIAGLIGTAGNTNGTGTSARFKSPRAIAQGPSNVLHVLDRNSGSTAGQLRLVTFAGVVTTPTVTGDAIGLGTQIAVTSDGTVYIVTGATIQQLTVNGSAFICSTLSDWTNTSFPYSIAVEGGVVGNPGGFLTVYDDNLTDKSDGRLWVGGPPVDPPVIDGVDAVSVTNNAATITWTTDVVSDSQVEYGLTVAYGSTTTLDATPVTSHSQNISGLAGGTTYHYRVISANAGGSDTSSDNTFTTIGPPVIAGVTAKDLTGTTATIRWTTDQAADSQVEYGTTTAYGTTTTLDTALVTSHAVGLTGLTIGTTYHYRVISANATAQSTTSGDYTFTAALPGPPDPLRPFQVATPISTGKDLTNPTHAQWFRDVRERLNALSTYVSTGNAATATKWVTPRLLAGNSVDGSANVPFANKFVVQGLTDTGLSGAQFLGALSTGIVKNATSTGVLSIAVAGDFPTLNQNTTGSAATLTTARTINGVSFDGSANITVTAAAGTLTGTTLASNVVASSLTSLGTIAALVAGTGTFSSTLSVTAADASLVLNHTTANHSSAINFRSSGTDKFIIGTGVYTANETEFCIGTGASALVTLLNNGLATFTSNVNVPNGSAFYWATRAALDSPADSKMRLRNNANTAGVLFDASTTGTLALLNFAASDYADLFVRGLETRGDVSFKSSGGSNVVTIVAATGNTAIGGTLGVTGASTIAALSATSGTFSSNLICTGQLVVNTNKFIVLSASGNTTVAGTLDVTGAIVGASSASFLQGSTTGIWQVGTALTVGGNGTIGIEATTDNAYDIGRSGAFRFRNIFLSGNATIGGVLKLPAYTVAGLPAGAVGDVAYVTDALAPAFLTAIVGGGAAKSPVFYNGTAWVGF